MNRYTRAPDSCIKKAFNMKNRDQKQHFINGPTEAHTNQKGGYLPQCTVHSHG